MSLTYKDAGVDTDRADSILENFSRHLKTRPQDPNVLSGIGPYASCYALSGAIANMEEPLLVTSCDGVGTKVKLALEWNQLDGLGHDLVAMNVNDLLCVGARPLNFLDYYACGVLREEQLGPLLKSIQSGCEAAGCTLVGGETAEMPGVYHGKDFDLAGFTVGVVDKQKMIGAHKVVAGDVVVAVASSGFHSNGYSLVRRIVEKDRIDGQAKSPFGTTWAEALLKPTTIYVKPLLPLLDQVHALAHITGGGLLGNLPRVLPVGTAAHIRSASWPLPPLFKWAQETAALSTEELLKTFNAGVGLIVICPATNVDAIVKLLAQSNLRAWPVGEIKTDDTRPVDPRVVWA